MPSTTHIEKIKAKPLQRAAIFDTSSVDKDARTIAIAFSSEEPVDRWFGREILDHSPQSVRLGRLQDGGPVLVDHDHRDHVGVIESVTIDNDRKGRALVRFGKSNRASEVFDDVADGIRRSISVGYRIHKAVIEERGEDGDAESYRITDWEPFEVSFVSVPADATVGVGRSTDDSENDFTIETNEPQKRQEVKVMPTDNHNTPAPIDAKAIADEARKAEMSRVNTLLATGEAYSAQQLARQAIEKGWSEADLNKAILESRGFSKPVEAAAPEIGLSDKEVREFSFLRAINALANPSDRRAQESAKFEFECSQAAAKRTGKDAQGIIVPVDVLKRDLTVGTTTAGGHTVSTDLLAGSFIDLLRARAVMMQLGTTLTDLNGNVAIPRMTGGATAYWVAESGAPTESQQAFDQVTLSPKTVGAFTDISRKLMLQSSMDVEALVRSDLATVLALEIDRAAINGSGASNQPTGILQTSGIGAVAGGTNGAAPTWANIVALETAVAQDNADLGRLAYVTNAKVRGKLKGTEKATSTAQFIWSGSELNGYNAMTTNQVPSDLDKGSSTGVCSAILFGNFADLLLGFWGGLDLTVDPYTGSTSGTVRCVALQDMDVAVRHAESFAAMKDALTA